MYGFDVQAKFGSCPFKVIRHTIMLDSRPKRLGNDGPSNGVANDGILASKGDSDFYK